MRSRIRRLLLSTVAGSALALQLVAPALALTLMVAMPTLTATVTAVSVECFTDHQGGVFISGTITINDAEAGDQVTILLEGRIGNSGYNAIAGFSDTVTLAAGQTTADYSIDITNLDPAYTNFRVASEGSTSNERSRSFDRDECSVVIPEVPFAPLLAISGGLLAVGWFVARSRRSTAESATA
jgi:hypothetical protein